MARLLIIACSQRKNPARGLLPAIDRYDGPHFLVLRKYLREGTEDALRILILSAKYGLIERDQPIPDYDCRITAAAAGRLRAQVLQTAASVIDEKSWASVGVCVGKDYQQALKGFSDLVPEGRRVDVIRGGQGQRLTALREWLRKPD